MRERKLQFSVSVIAHGFLLEGVGWVLGCTVMLPNVYAREEKDDKNNRLPSGKEPSQ